VAHARAHEQHPWPPKPTATTIAVIGDIPYGDALIAEFPQDIKEINADPDVSRRLNVVRSLFFARPGRTLGRERDEVGSERARLPVP